MIVMDLTFLYVLRSLQCLCIKDQTNILSNFLNTTEYAS